MHAGVPATVPDDTGLQKTTFDSSSSPSSRRSDSTTHPPSVTAPDYSPFTTVSSQSSSPEPNLEMLGLLGSEGTYRSTPAYPTFKIVGDNLDKYVKPRDMRIDAQASTLHYFNMYAVRDRLDTSRLSDSPSLPDLSTTETVVNPHTSKQVIAISDCFHYVLFGGDLLTAKRARGGQEIRENSEGGIVWKD